jgi:hypothetical protein
MPGFGGKNCALCHILRQSLYLDFRFQATYCHFINLFMDFSLTSYLQNHTIFLLSFCSFRLLKCVYGLENTKRCFVVKVTLSYLELLNFNQRFTTNNTYYVTIPDNT